MLLSWRAVGHKRPVWRCTRAALVGAVEGKHARFTGPRRLGFSLHRAAAQALRAPCRAAHWRAAAAVEAGGGGPREAAAAVRKVRGTGLQTLSWRMAETLAVGTVRAGSPHNKMRKSLVCSCYIPCLRPHVAYRVPPCSLALISAAAHTAAAAAEAEALVEAVPNSKDPRAAGARLFPATGPTLHDPRAPSAEAASAGWLAGGCLRDLGPGLAEALARACYSDTLGGVAWGNGNGGVAAATEDSNTSSSGSGNSSLRSCGSSSSSSSSSGSSSPRSCSSNSSSMRDVQSRLLHANAAARDHATEVWEGDAWGRYGLVRGWGPVALSRRRYCRVVGGALAETAGRYGLAAAHRRWWLLRAAWCGLALEAVAPLPQP